MSGFTIDGHRFDAPPLSPGLYVVSTPVGHLRDMSLRGLETLAAAGTVACEDARVTRKLLQRYDIRARTRAYNDHSSDRDRTALLDLATAEPVALVSDAGTPLLSDPGFRLVSEARVRGVRIAPVPGASALLAALAVAGLPTDRFVFEGFLPPKTAARRARIDRLDRAGATVALYEAPQRLVATLADMVDRLGAEREGAVARELTKTFEEVRRGSLQALHNHYRDTPPKGEIVLLLAPKAEAAPDDLDVALREALKRHRVKDAAREIAALYGVPRAQVYARALALKDEAGGGP